MNYIIRFAIALLTLLLLSCTNANKTNLSQPKNDSIKKYLELASNNALPFKKRKGCNDKIFSLVLKMNNSLEKRKFCKSILSNCFLFKDWDKYKILSRVLFQDSKKENDIYYIALSQRSIGNYFYEKQILDSSYYYFLKAKKNYLKVNEKKEYAIIEFKIALIQYLNNDYIASELSLKKAYIILSKLDDYKRTCDVLNEQGLVNIGLKNYDLAEKNYFDALEIINNHKNDFYIKEFNLYEVCLGNLAFLYTKKKDYINSCYYCKKTLLTKDLKHKDPELYSNTIEILAWSKMKLNDDKDLSKLFLESLSIRKKLNILYRISDSYYDLSEFYLFKKDSILAKKYAEKALFYGLKSKTSYSILNGLRQVGYTNKNRAQQCIDEYDIKSDSLLDVERKTRNQFYKIQLDVDEITQEKDNAIIQKWVIASMMSCILLIVILLFVIFYQKSKQKEVKLLQAQQKANEETYQMFLNQQALQDEAKTVEKKRIALELHDNILNKLASIRFNLYPITQKNDPEIQKNAEKHVNRIKDVEDEIRTISHDFSNDLFAEAYSFKIILQKLIDEQNKLYPDTQYRLELEEKINLDSISSKIKMNMYRIIQEALYNVHKHAKATKVAVAIIQDENNICISILDNGIGFDTAKTKEGIGIKNIKLRIKQLSGKISVISSTKHGTAINMAIPIVTINK
jgi:signal transduction histidine kinase